MSYQFQTNNADAVITPKQFVLYTPEPYTYLRSGTPNENTERAYVWVANELYEFLLVNPLITKTIYESKDRSAYISLVEFFVKRVPNGLYDSDFFHDWTLNGENNGFMRQIRSAYSEYQKICEKFAPKKM